MQIKRLKPTLDKSLKPWSAADEYLLQHIQQLENPPTSLAIYNDRFGFLSCHLHELQPTIIITQKSQEKAIQANLEANEIALLNFSDPLVKLDKEIDVALIKIPKSLALFQLFLEHLVNNSIKDVKVFAGFMTRHFTPKLLEIAGQYFEVLEQSKALKKARLLILSKRKEPVKKLLVTTLSYNDQEYQQYFGVFSADHIDYATQFFLSYLKLKKTEQKILDLASGNGIIGLEIAKQIPEAEVHLLDDSFLAVASARLNSQSENVHHHFENNLSVFSDETFDLIVTNPPFHFEYEINIQIPIQLFKDCFRCLKPGGHLQLVANRHLNYKVHLEKLFSSVEVVGENEKFVVYDCLKNMFLNKN